LGKGFGPSLWGWRNGSGFGVQGSGLTKLGNRRPWSVVKSPPSLPRQKTGFCFFGLWVSGPGLWVSGFGLLGSINPGVWVLGSENVQED